jgi:DNA-binding XRE family transcriptional regulator
MLVTQSKLAQILGATFDRVNRSENGKYEPTTKIKKKLSELFNEYEIDLLNN